MFEERAGVPLVVSAPSGAGKTTLCRKLMERVGRVEYSISHTTRAPRGAEKNGVDYHFVDDAAFDEMVAANDFLEWAAVHSKRYGTSKEAVAGKLAAGTDVLLDIDVQGGLQIAQRMPDAILLFVLPPSQEILERRLRARGSDSEEQIQTRLAAANEEIRRAADYSHWLINDDLDRAVDELHAILVAERLKRLDRSAVLKAFRGEVS